VGARGATRGSRPVDLLRSRRAADAPERDDAAVVVARTRIAERICLADEMQPHGDPLRAGRRCRRRDPDDWPAAAVVNRTRPYLEEL